MLVRVASVVAALCAALPALVLADSTSDSEASHAIDQANQANTHIEARTLADLADGMSAFVLSPSQTRQDIEFALPPNSDTHEAWLRLAARPASETTTGRIHVTVNGGEAITIRPQARAMEARFALFSADFRPGLNTLTISYSTDTASAGWIVDTSRLSTFPCGKPSG